MDIYINNTYTTNFLYLVFLYFAEAFAGKSMPAKFLLRNDIFGHGANKKCPAREVINFRSLNLARAGAGRKQPFK